MSTSYGLLISTIITDQEATAALIPLLIIPLMLSGGYFRSVNDMPKFFYIFEYISMLKYGFQAGIMNNYRSNIDCGPGIGICDILT
jgi:ABC-type multidrug transport system permease subunit